MERESKFLALINPDCLEDHTTITATSRWIILNWIREVVVEHKLTRLSFYAAVQFLDIFLSQESFEEDRLQLIAVTALLVALKSYEVEQLTIEVLVQFLWDEQNCTPLENFKQKEAATRFLLKYEFKLVKIMKCDLLYPNALDFLRHAYQFATLHTPMVQEPIPLMLFDSRTETSSNSVLHPQYNTMAFVKAADILDKVIMDVVSLNFAPSLLAAAVFWKTYPRLKLTEGNSH